MWRGLPVGGMTPMREGRVFVLRDLAVWGMEHRSHCKETDRMKTLLVRHGAIAWGLKDTKGL